MVDCSVGVFVDILLLEVVPVAADVVAVVDVDVIVELIAVEDTVEDDAVVEEVETV